jgi:hypothetical protein
MRSGLSLTDLAKKLFTLEARRKQSCLLPQAYRFRFKTLFEGLCLLKSIALDHSMFPVVWAGARVAFSSPIDARGLAVMNEN